MRLAMLSGFLVAWNLWLFSVLYAASVGLVTVTYLAYATGKDAEVVVAHHKWIVFVATICVLAWLMLAAHLGLRVGKWVSNAGSALTIVAILFLAALPYFRHAAEIRVPRTTIRIRVRLVPPLTLFSLSVFSKMTFGALCGLEYTATSSPEPEPRDPARHLDTSHFYRRAHHRTALHFWH